MYQRILHIALPSIVSNITVPLLSLADTAIVGHLGAAAYIGAIAVGGMLFNLIYWLFGFLRMGTGGLTAQAHGARDENEQRRILVRSLTVSAAIALLLILLQRPILSLAFLFITATPEVQRWATVYFHVLIWGAPAMLGLYSFVGWFLGQQNARIPMAIAIVQNVINIGASLLLVYAVGWKVEGVATGTLIAQYAGLLMALVLWWRNYRNVGRSTSLRGAFGRTELRKFFSVNRDIFLRTLCLISVMLTFTATGAKQGESVLAANALLMQFYLFFSYVMDGFAYAGEAIGGSCFGEKDAQGLLGLKRTLFRIGAALVAMFTLAYFFLGQEILGLLTDNAAIVALAATFLPFVALVPVCGFAAFLYDGIFIGTTATRGMLISVGAAMVAFFLIEWLFPLSNVALWAAYLAFLLLRGSVQALLFPKIVKQIKT